MIVSAVVLASTQLLGEAYAYGDETLVQGDAANATATFQRACLSPFPDEKAFLAVMSTMPDFKRVNAAEAGTLRRDGVIVPAVGGVWTSPTINVRYISQAALDPALLQPQCSLTVRLATTPDHAALVAAIGARLSLRDPQEVRVGPYERTYWNVPQSDGANWRISLKAQGGAQGDYMKLSLVKLRKTM